MSRLQMRTKTDPQPRMLSAARCRSLSRVYFAAHPADFPRYRDALAGEIYRTHDCAFCFDSRPDAPYDEATLADLQTMHLFVLPITTRLLTDTAQRRVLEQDLAIAKAHKIPVLPLMQEEGLEYLYEKTAPLQNLQFLSKHTKDLTALAYADKLKVFLDSVLLSQAQMQEIRDAFAARIFLSYRKKDRALAQSLMRTIHRHPALRDVAIWYDEFLTPGEDFNCSIRQALGDAHLFTLAVTPFLLEQGNYVIVHEYPAALELEKPVLPVQVQADAALQEDFAAVFLTAEADPDKQERIAELVQPMCRMDAALHDAVRTQLEKKLGTTLAENNDALQQYRMGLAYLRGLDVEKDTVTAIALLERAAAQGEVRAMSQLTELYSVGQGAEPDPALALEWNRKTVTRYQELFAAGHRQVQQAMLYATLALADKLFRLRDGASLSEASALLHHLTEQFDEDTDPAFFAKLHHNLGVIACYQEPPRGEDVLRHMQTAIRLEKAAAAQESDPAEEPKRLLKRLVSAGAACLQSGLQAAAQVFLEDAEGLYREDWASVRDYEILGQLAVLAFLNAGIKRQGKTRDKGDADLARAEKALLLIPDGDKRSADWETQNALLLELAHRKYWSIEAGKLKDKVVKRLKKEIKDDLGAAYEAAQQYIASSGESLAAREALCDTLYQSISLHRLLHHVQLIPPLEQELLALAEEIKDVTGHTDTMMTLSRTYGALAKTRSTMLQAKGLDAGQKDALLAEALGHFETAETFLRRYEQRGGQPEVLGWAGLAYGKGGAYSAAGRYAEALTEYRTCETLLEDAILRRTWVSPQEQELLRDCRKDASVARRKLNTPLN